MIIRVLFHLLPRLTSVFATQQCSLKGISKIPSNVVVIFFMPNLLPGKLLPHFAELDSALGVSPGMSSTHMHTHSYSK